MRKINRVTAFALAGAATLALAGCSTGGGASSSLPDGIPDSVDAKGETLTVWVMQDDYSEATLDAINEEFTERTGAEVDVQMQPWDGISTKLSTALGTSTPPDVVDIGNTQVAGYATNGALLDVTDYREDLAQGQTWLGGLEEPATVDGSLYGIPGFAGNRAVIYNKTMWAEAGVTEAPTTWDELTAALDTVAAANPAEDFSPLYLPGQHWYVGLQFMWDHGGEIATQEDGEWVSTAGSDASLKGIEAWKEFQNTYSAESSRTVSADKPEQEQILADGKAGAIIASNGSVTATLNANPELTEADLGTFALPGQNEETQPVMLGGSVWGIAAKSANPELALIWTQIAVNPDIQTEYVFGDQGLMPNSEESIEAVEGDLSEVKAGFFQAALNSRATPAAPGWTEVEGANLLQNLFSTVASGAATPEEAAAAYDAKAGEALK
ncbi:extracellular solute-binding protein [Mycetocola zhadangensis]|uniref:Extracellular solute-binding protein n=1 Tax=Mycetocola zhadangensis TaxID=1164595 RepID=A0A3L7J6V5_9MICO|nr:extracellular solute-binding protein [Mycetocola zhadangensis]RLQ86403.1 extracellular solute-binding protein [Mycetocola zhadangensis]GGE90909.1 sugar ABC transporter substrate-binding protein [Mycetocola zhadangensis]